MNPRLENIESSNAEQVSKKLKEYTIQKWQWIYRVFVNLWLNYNEKTKQEIGKLQDILTKKIWNIEPIWIKEGDKYILDSDFVVHIERNWEEKLVYALLKHEKKEKEVKKVIASTKLEIKKHREDFNEEERLKELIKELDQEAGFKYYYKLVFETESEEEDIKEEKIKIEKILEDTSLPVKKDRKNNLKVEKADKKNEKETKSILKHLKKGKLEKKWILLSKEMKKKIISYIDRINPSFKEHLWHVYDIAKEYKLHPALLLAVMQNDSWLWKHLYSKNNFWNVWNTDKLVSSGKKWTEYRSPRSGIKALARNLRSRVDSYTELYPDKIPTTKELMSGISKDWTRFYGRYMSKADWPEKVNNFYNKIASR